jgi:hypothetical protein
MLATDGKANRGATTTDGVAERDPTGVLERDSAPDLRATGGNHPEEASACEWLRSGLIGLAALGTKCD